MVTSSTVCVCGHSRGDHLSARHNGTLYPWICGARDIDRPGLWCGCSFYDARPNPK